MVADSNGVLALIRESGIVAVIRAGDADRALRIASACQLGGITALEITFTVPGAQDVIRSIAAAPSEENILVGAGTVLDPETARIAILAGAQFIVSPCLNAGVATLCNRYRIPYIPGAMTLKEVVEAMELGADIVKIFPGELFGPKIISAFRGPLPHASLMPTGGVTLENVGDWVRAGAVAVGIGSYLTNPALEGDYDAVTEIAKVFVSKVNEARRSMKGA